MNESDEFTPFLEWTIENVRIPDRIQDRIQDRIPERISERIPERIYEKHTLEICVKLLLHIMLISIFETLFYFLYISSLENSGIEWTISTFINEAVHGCERMNSTQIEKINDILKKYINPSDIINIGNNQESVRTVYNNMILSKAWRYIYVLMGLFSIVIVYVKCRCIKITWSYIVLENTAMVGLLALYELLFFNTIIYPYQPISTDEIERNMIEQLQNSCGLLT